MIMNDAKVFECHTNEVAGLAIEQLLKEKNIDLEYGVPQKIEIEEWVLWVLWNGDSKYHTWIVTDEWKGTKWSDNEGR
jgi:hypothetical protein